MPFKSEKQRRYLWANEPEIARDWTETYGSKIQKANGGITRLNYRYGGDTMGGPNDRSNQGPAGGASAGGNYGGNRSGGVSPNQMSGAGPSTRDRPNPHTISGTSKDTFVSPNAILNSPQFTQEGRDTFIQNLRGPTLGQRIGQGIGNLASGVGDYITSGGMWGALLRGLGSLSKPGTGNVGPAGIKTDGTYGTVTDAIRASRRNEPIINVDNAGMPLWAQLGYPSYEAFLAAQNQGISGIEGIDVEDETEIDDFIQRFRLADAYRQQPGTMDTPIKYT